MQLDVDGETIRRALDLDRLRDAMAEALASYSAGQVAQPVRTVVPSADGAGFLFTMPARTPTALGVKIVTFYPENRAVPTHHAVVAMFEPATGVPTHTLDGGVITELRTAAVSAVAADRLARTDASALALIGAGVQAAAHLEALRRIRPLDDVRVWSPRSATSFADRHPAVRAVGSAEEAARDADIVVVATTSREPVLEGSWLRPGTFVATVGAARPDWRELDDEVLATARLVVDSRAAAGVESGDIRRALELGRSIDAELGEVVSGAARGRSGDDEILLFKSLGMAVEDVAAAELVLTTLRDSR